MGKTDPDSDLSKLIGEVFKNLFSSFVAVIRSLFF